jgi:DNA ligase-associated metallophosphoesterase
MRGIKQIQVCGQHLLLSPERAVFWKQARMLIVADPHFGKAQVFRANGIPVPVGTTSDDIGRLSALMEGLKPDELLVLGDLMHGRIDSGRAFSATIDKWRRRWSGVRFCLVTGNHDLRAGPPPASFRFDRIVAQRVTTPFVFTHEPAAHAGSYVIAGHVHPAVAVVGKARQKETLRCFCFGETRGLLPAFGSFTGNRAIRPQPRERVYGIAGSDVIEIKPPP